MAGRLTAAACVVLLGLAGCAGTPTAPPTVTITVTPSASATRTPTTSVAPTSVAPTSGAPSGPPAASVVDVSTWKMADFASPSGRIWCGLSATGALCHFPRGFTGKIPSGDTVCPGEGLDVTGISTTASGTKYFCSGDPSVFPVKGHDEVKWNLETDFGFVGYDGFVLAVLPYGKTLRHGSYQCTSAESGVTCTSTITGHGFKIALAGVTLL